MVCTQRRNPPGSRRRPSSRPCLEDLENRTAPAVLSIVPAAGAAISVQMRPTFQLWQGIGAATEAVPRGSSPASFLQPLWSGSVSGFSPQQIRTAYGIDAISWGAIKGDGTGQTIAIVDAYDDPNLVNSTSPNFSISDLAQFDKQFGLPDPPSFTKIAQDGSTNLPQTDGTGEWEIEESLDVEWAHAIAPGASIVLVECHSASDQDLMSTGVQTAAALPGVSVVSMSFGAAETAYSTYYNSDFRLFRF